MTLPPELTPMTAANFREAVFVIAANGTIEFVTPVAAQVYGYTVDEVIGQPADQYIAPQDVEQVRQWWCAMRDNPGRSSAELDVSVRTAAGGQVPARVSIWRLPGGDRFLAAHHVLDVVRDRLQTLYSVLTAVSGTLDPDQIVDIVLRETQRLIPTGSSTLFVLGASGKLEFARSFGHSADDFSDVVLTQQMEFDTVRTMRETGQALFINDCDHDPRWTHDPTVTYIKSWLGAPLIYRGEFLGVLNLDSTRPNAFTVEDAQLAQALASQAAVALHNARRYNEELLRARRFQAINDVNLALSHLNLASLLEVVYRKASGLMDTSTFFIGLYDAEAGLVHLVGSYDHGQPRPDESQPADLGITGLVLRTRQTLILNDTESEPVPPEIIIQDEMPRSVLMVPLTTQDEIVGVMSVQSYRPHAYTAEDISMLESIAGATASAIRNAQLYDQTASRLGALETLHQMALALAYAQSPDVIAELVITAAHALARPAQVQFILDPRPAQPAQAWTSTVAESGALSIIPAKGGPAASRLVEEARATGQPVVLGDLRDQPARQAEFGTPWPVQAAAISPVRSGQDQLGVLALLYDAPQIVRRDLLRTLDLLCIQVAAALKNAEYTVTLRRQLNETAALHELARRVSSSQTLDEILDLVVKTVHDIFHCKAAGVALYDPDENMVVMRAAVGLKEEHFKQARFALGEYVAGQVVATGEVIYVPDTYADPNFRLIDPDLRSLLVVPLTVQDRTIGTLSIDSAEPRAFTSDHERLLTIAGSQIAAAIETVRLLDETRHHAEQLAAANAELAALDELRTKLLQDVSHELRSPLSLVRGYAGLLRDGELGEVIPQQVEALDIIDQRAELITKLIGDILAAEQISPKTLELGTVDLAQLCACAVEGMSLVHHDEALTFELDLQASACWVDGDRNRLSQVLDNLLGNAAKFSPDGGTITLRVMRSADGQRVTVSVTDQGIGIAADRLPHLFERFYQGDRMIKHRFGGSGLGLYIVKQIIEAHGGTVWVDSQEGQGSTFSFALPVREG